MKNLISLKEAVKVRCAAPAVGSGCAAHHTLWWEMQTSVKTGVLKKLVLRYYGKWFWVVFLKWELLIQ